jgi:hypothetical protein
LINIGINTYFIWPNIKPALWATIMGYCLTAPWFGGVPRLVLIWWLFCANRAEKAIQYYHQGRKIPSWQEKETSYGLGYAFKGCTRVHDAVSASPCIMPIQRNWSVECRHLVVTRSLWVVYPVLTRPLDTKILARKHGVIDERIVSFHWMKRH